MKKQQKPSYSSSKPYKARREAARSLSLRGVRNERRGNLSAGSATQVKGEESSSKRAEDPRRSFTAFHSVQDDNEGYLHIENLHAETADGKQILRGVSLTITKGEIHALMGPNGSGKSTMAAVLMGHPGYIITEGSITVNGVDITSLSPDQRAKHGLFLGFQYPVEVAGVNFANFLRLAINKKRESRIMNQESGKKLSPMAFRNEVFEYARTLAFNSDINKRSLNEGFSGGEKKKAEILQLALLKPDFAILDEPDSGLDVDALRYIAKAIKALNYPFGLLLITHYQRILYYIKPDFVHVLVDGKIVKEGKAALAKQIEKSGYEQFLNG